MTQETIIQTYSTEKQSTPKLRGIENIQSLRKSPFKKTSHERKALGELQIAQELQDISAKLEKKKIKIDVTTKDKHGATLLHRKSSKGKLGSIQKLLDLDSDIDAVDNSGWTALHYSILAPNGIHVIKKLLDSGAKFLPDLKGKTILHYAARTASSKVIKLLCEKGQEFVNQKDSMGMTPLHLAGFKGNAEAMRALLKAGADINALDDDGNTVLHLLAGTENIEALRVAISYGANPHKENRCGATPLHGAVFNESVQNARLLIEAGAKFKNKLYEFGKYTPVHLAARIDNPEMIKLFVEYRADIDQEDANLQTPLHIAVKKGLDENVGMLFRALMEPDVDARDKDGMTPLHYAAEFEDTNILHFLLLKEANPNIQDKDGETPLHIAIDADDKAMVKLLLKFGADPTIQDNGGKSAFHYALEDNGMVSLILQTIVSRESNHENDIEIVSSMMKDLAIRDLKLAAESLIKDHEYVLKRDAQNALEPNVKRNKIDSGYTSEESLHEWVVNFVADHELQNEEVSDFLLGHECIMYCES